MQKRRFPARAVHAHYVASHAGARRERMWEWGQAEADAVAAATPEPLREVRDR